MSDRSDIGFGSFYNHFESKEALFEAAVESVLDVYAVVRDEPVAGYDDPAEVFAVSFRMTGRCSGRFRRWSGSCSTQILTQMPPTCQTS